MVHVPTRSSSCISIAGTVVDLLTCSRCVHRRRICAPARTQRSRARAAAHCCWLPAPGSAAAARAQALHLPHSATPHAHRGEAPPAGYSGGCLSRCPSSGNCCLAEVYRHDEQDHAPTTGSRNQTAFRGGLHICQGTRLPLVAQFVALSYARMSRKFCKMPLACNAWELLEPLESPAGAGRIGTGHCLGSQRTGSAALRQRC